MHLKNLTDRQGFTLVELMISLAIIGILIATTIPLANMYRLKAEYLELRTTARYLMDGMETHYLETNQLYPTLPEQIYATTSFSVAKDEEKYIPELKFTFPKGHKHKYTFEREKFVFKMNFWGMNIDTNYDHAWITIGADFDYDRDGNDDEYIIYMWLDHDRPVNRFQVAPGIYKDRYRAFE